MITAGMWDSIWPSDSVLGQAVVLVILGLGIWALRSAMFHLARYQREGACLAELEGRVRRWREGSPEAPQEGAGEVEETAEGPGEPENLEGASPALLDLSELQEGLDRGTLVWQRVRSLEVLASHRGKVDVASLRRQSLERDEATKGWTAPGFVSGLAMLLGIFGTFLGLAAMVQQIQLGLPTAQDAVTSEALQESISHLRTVLGGMKTAFATSIAGMSCALVAGSLDTTLTELGHQQAAEAAVMLSAHSISGVYSSPLRRARDTAAPIAERLNLPVIVIPQIAERNWGSLEGQPRGSRARGVTPEGAETIEEFSERVLAGFARIDAGLPLIVGHSGVFRVICRTLEIVEPEAPVTNALPLRLTPFERGWTLESV